MILAAFEDLLPFFYFYPSSPPFFNFPSILPAPLAPLGEMPIFAPRNNLAKNDYCR